MWSLLWATVAAVAALTLALAAAALAAVALSLGRLTLAWAASALALWAAQRLGGAVRPGLPERLVPRPPFLLGPRECTHDVVSMLATPRRDARIRRRVQHIVPAPLVAPF